MAASKKKRSSGMDAKLLIVGGRGIKAQKQVKGWPGSSNIKSGRWDGSRIINPSNLDRPPFFLADP